jgi:hypothetical protein
MFVGAGISYGNQAWNNKTSKRRRDLARAFEDFKANNPYATAEDFNSYLESVIGPEEYYLRGSVPGQGVINRIAEDNAKRKEQDERTRALEAATREMQVSDTMQQMAMRMLPTHSDEQIVENMLQYMPGDDPETREKNRQRISQTLNLSGMRHKMQQEQAARAAAAAQAEAERKRKAYGTYMQNLMSMAPNISDLAANPETEEFLKGTLQASAYAAGIEWDDKLEGYSMDFLRNTRNQKINATQPQANQQAYDNIKQQSDARLEAQGKQMAAAAKSTEDPLKQAAIEYGHQRYAFDSPEDIASFTSYVNKYDGDAEAASDVVSDWYNNVKGQGVNERSSLDDVYRNQADSIAPPPRTAVQFVQNITQGADRLMDTTKRKIDAKFDRIDRTQSIDQLAQEASVIPTQRAEIMRWQEREIRKIDQHMKRANNWMLDYNDIMQNDKDEIAQQSVVRVNQVANEALKKLDDLERFTQQKAAALQQRAAKQAEANKRPAYPGMSNQAVPRIGDPGSLKDDTGMGFAP